MSDSPINGLDFSTIQVSDVDQRLIHAIAARAARILKVDILTCEMDLMAVHANGNPLRLSELVVADGYEFAHDVGGIMSNIDRSTGQLLNFFDPRFTDYEVIQTTRLEDAYLVES